MVLDNENKLQQKLENLADFTSKLEKKTDLNKLKSHKKIKPQPMKIQTQLN